MFSLSFVGGSESAKEGPNPPADLDWEGSYTITDLDRGGLDP